MTTYVILIARGLAVVDADDPTSEEPRVGLPAYHLFDRREAHNPAAACLAAAEEHNRLIDDDVAQLVAVPARNWHETPLKPTRGFELAPPEGSLLSTPEGEPADPGMGAAE
jgi:hypothetical protein